VLEKNDMNAADLSALIKSKAVELGYDLCGITHAGVFEELVRELDRRSGLFPESAKYYQKLYPCADPGQFLEGARSVVVCAGRYNRYVIPRSLEGHIGKVYLFDPRLSFSKEYASTAAFESFLKGLGVRVRQTSMRTGVSARQAAVRAGLGRFGKNNFVYTKFGSWVWIDTFTVDRELEYDKPKKTRSPCPPECTKCIEACPTKALTAPFTMNYANCVARLTFRLEGLPAEPQRRQMGQWIYGCDACQDVCPLNGKWSEEEEFPDPDRLPFTISLPGIYGMDLATLKKVLQPRFWYIKEEYLWTWKTNCLRAMANSGNLEYLPFIDAACNDPDENIRTMGKWARERISERTSSE
jgi:epoxyqueuosine reductase